MNNLTIYFLFYSAMRKCDSMRVFLYDLGLINRTTLGKEFVPLNSKNDRFLIVLIMRIINCKIFRILFTDLMHTMIDQTPVLLNETVSIFYVKGGQRTSSAILQNCVNF